MEVIIIGGGPAGMLAAISASNAGCHVTLIEKNDRLGKKLAITGKGRCNITSSLDISEFVENIPGNGRFLYSAFKNFDNKDILSLINIPTKEERGHRIFPVSDRAQDVVEALKRKLENNNIDILYNTEAKEIEVDKEDNKVTGVVTNKGKLKADKVILATGGKSYPGTGSTGDGYNIARKLGHTITEIRPSLVGLTTEDEDLRTCQELQGLTLKNASLELYENNKKVYDDFGEILFTHYGLSGPIILSASAHLVRTKMNNPKVILDLKSGLTEEKLNDRILRDFEKYKNKDIRNGLKDLLPQKMIPVIIRLMGVSEYKKVNEITREERLKLVNLLKKFEIKITGFSDIKEAIVTAGGVSVKEINPKTMESKLVKGLYFAGEVIDVDAYTGGFNLQIAYSTGYTAGLNNEYEN